MPVRLYGAHSALPGSLFSALREASAPDSVATGRGAIEMRFKGLFWALSLLAASATIAAQLPAERDWGAALRRDAQALHDDIAANHPGPVNPKDPGFAERNDSQLALALSRAREAGSYADYFFALRQYVSSFDDGHMGIGAFGFTPNDLRWPGFLTGYDGRGDIKVVLTTDWGKVPVGAKLLGCDGMTAARYSEATLGKMWGRWHLESQWHEFGGMLFMDEGSRYIPQARRCRFEVDGRSTEIPLEWRAVDPKERRELMKSVMPARSSKEFATRVLDDGTRWYSIPSFNPDPKSPAGKALPAMIAAMRSDRPALAAAPAIVLDVRGNGGGSSDWSRQIAEVLWGRAALAKLPRADIQVDWRVSPANLESMKQDYARQGGVTGLSPEMRAWFETVIEGLGDALERGEQLWRQPAIDLDRASGAPARRERPPARLKGKVYLLTDFNCGSACLDAVDRWRALGAIHVGRTTSADTLYMDTRQFRLPEGIVGGGMPRKVYRGRPRGSNEPVVPVHLFDGDIADTAALERWIATLGPVPKR